MARRRYRQTWDDVEWIDCDFMATQWAESPFKAKPDNSDADTLELDNGTSAPLFYDPATDELRIFYTLKADTQPTLARIQLERRPQSFGGARVYFRAPCCQRRVRKVALLPDGVRCGPCGSIQQPSRRKGRTRRLIWKADKLAGQLGCDNWHSEPNERPVGMRRETFARLAVEHAKAKQNALRIVGPRLARAQARGGPAYLMAMLKAEM
jgi:hypothetical protein